MNRTVIFTISTVVFMCGCTLQPAPKNDVSTDAIQESSEDRDSMLKDWPFPGANGNYLIMRSSDPEPPDTIVDEIGYRRVY